MKKLSALSGVATIWSLTCVILSRKGECLKSKNRMMPHALDRTRKQPLSNELLNLEWNDLWLIETSVFIEIEEEIDLGFRYGRLSTYRIRCLCRNGLDLNGIWFCWIRGRNRFGLRHGQGLSNLQDSSLCRKELDLNEIDLNLRRNIWFLTQRNYLPAGFDANRYGNRA